MPKTKWNDEMIEAYYRAALRHGGENMIKKIAEDLGVEESEVQREAKNLREVTEKKKKKKNNKASTSK